MAYFSPVLVFQKMTQWSTLSGLRNAYTTVFRKYPHWEGRGEEGIEEEERRERRRRREGNGGKEGGGEERIEEEERRERRERRR